MSEAIAKDQLRSIINRIENLEAEKNELARDIREVYASAKSEGFDVKALRQIIKIRKQGEAERAELEALVDLYMSAIEGA